MFTRSKWRGRAYTRSCKWKLLIWIVPSSSSRWHLLAYTRHRQKTEKHISLSDNANTALSHTNVIGRQNWRHLHTDVKRYYEPAVWRVLHPDDIPYCHNHSCMYSVNLYLLVSCHSTLFKKQAVQLAWIPPYRLKINLRCWKDRTIFCCRER